jgi:anaerobic ribonucleoside-triphosphate reductase activating protein
MVINLHSFLARSTENGPGIRAVIWVQGCTLQCLGCFNPDTHDLGIRTLVSVEELTDRILAIAGIEGITISGGEPFLQAGALAALGSILQRQKLGIIVFSGFTLEQITQRNDPEWNALVAVTDPLVDGPFIQSLTCNLPLRGSSNQQLHYLSERYKPDQESLNTGTSGVEVFIDESGQVVVTGFPTGETLRVFSGQGS